MMAIVSVITLAFANEIGGSHLAVSAVLACVAIAGIILSGPLRYVVGRRGVARVVYAVAALGASPFMFVCWHKGKIKFSSDEYYFLVLISSSAKSFFEH